MTVSRILAMLSSSDLVIEVEVIEMNVEEPKTQSIRAKAILKKSYALYVNEGIGDIRTIYKKKIKRYVDGTMHHIGKVLERFRFICTFQTMIRQ